MGAPNRGTRATEYTVVATTTGARHGSTPPVITMKTTSLRKYRRTGTPWWSAIATPTSPAFTAKKTAALSRTTGNSPVLIGCGDAMWGASVNARRTIRAAAIESVYWPTLNRTRHHGLPASKSWITEANAWVIRAGHGPPTSSSANENDVERVISSSLPRRGILTGSSSHSTTPEARNANATGSRST